MLLFFKSLIETFSTLSWVDIVFFLAVMFLIILVVTLIYFIIINDEEDNNTNKEEKNMNKEPIAIFEDPNEQGELIDLKTLTEKLESKESDPIAMNDYEEEQEQRAIISYDELLEKHQNLKINYEDEQQVGDITIKKVDLDNISTPVEKEEEIEKPRVISYEKEEAFLEALKKLQKQIN